MSNAENFSTRMARMFGTSREPFQKGFPKDLTDVLIDLILLDHQLRVATGKDLEEFAPDLARLVKGKLEERFEGL